MRIRYQHLLNIVNNAAAVEKSSQSPYSLWRYIILHSIADTNHNPTIYMVEAPIRGSPTLLPPLEWTEREGTGGFFENFSTAATSIYSSFKGSPAETATLVPYRRGNS